MYFVGDQKFWSEVVGLIELIILNGRMPIIRKLRKTVPKVKYIYYIYIFRNIYFVGDQKFWSEVIDLIELIILNGRMPCGDTANCAVPRVIQVPYFRS